MESRNTGTRYFHLSFIAYAISFFILLVSIFGVNSFLADNTTYKLMKIIFSYIIPVQMIGLILTSVGLMKTLSFDSKRNKILGRVCLFLGLGFLFVFVCILFLLVFIFSNLD
jgi:hypothetical protein